MRRSPPEIIRSRDLGTGVHIADSELIFFKMAVAILSLLVALILSLHDVLVKISILLNEHSQGAILQVLVLWALSLAMKTANNYSHNNGNHDYTGTGNHDQIYNCYTVTVASAFLMLTTTIINILRIIL